MTQPPDNPAPSANAPGSTDPATVGNALPFRQRLHEVIAGDPEFRWLHLAHGGQVDSFTLRDLHSRIADYCRLYQDRGLRPGETVVIILKESLDLFASFYAGIIHGALPAYFAYPSPKQTHDTFIRAVNHLVQYNEIRLVIGYDEVIHLIESHAVISHERFCGFVLADAVPHGPPIDLLSLPAPPEEAFLQFSSGTTGAKKGVKISSTALFNQIRAYEKHLQYDRDSRVASWLPHYHDMGLVACMLIPTLTKIPIYMMSPFEWVANPRCLLNIISQYSCTHLWQPNFALGHLTKSIPDDELSRYSLRSIKQLVCCSEPVLFGTVDRFVHKFSRCGLEPKALNNCYAMAENTFAVTASQGGGITFIFVDPAVLSTEQRIVLQDGGKPMASAGVPLENVTIRIADENGRPLGEDWVGEVRLRSNCMLDSYHNNPLATAEAFDDGWFKTGDLGFIHDGELFITGRKKELIIIGGENIYPQDIEAILNDRDGLLPGRNVVFGVEDDTRGTERLVVLAEVNDGCETMDTTAIRREIADALSITVSEMHLLPHMTLRKGTAGKISRYLNKQAYLDGAFGGLLSTDTSGQPADDLLQFIRGLFPRQIGPSATAQTPLLSSGLIDSFGFLDLVTALENRYGVRIPQAMLRFENFDTVEQIRATLSQLTGKAIPATIAKPTVSETASPTPTNWLIQLIRFLKD